MRASQSPSSVELRLGGLRAFTGAAVGTLVAQGLVAVLGAGTMVLTARSLGPSGQGQVSTVLAVALFMGVSIGGSVLPSVVHLSARGVDPDELRGSALAVGGLSSVALLAVFALLAETPVSEIAFDDATGDVVRAGALVAFLIPLDRAVNGLMRSRGLVTTAAFTDVGESLLVLGLVAWFSASDGLTPSRALLAYGAGIAGSFLVLGLASGVHRCRPGHVNRGVIRQISAFGRPVWMGYAAQYAIYRLDLVVLGAVTGSSAAGSYAVAARFGEILTLVPAATAQVTSPRSAHLSRAQLTRSTPRIYWALVAISASLAAVVGAMAPVLLSILFGSEFEDSAGVARLLLLAVVLIAPSRILSEELVQVGSPRIALRNSMLALAVAVLAWAALIPMWGATGAAVGSVIAYGVNASATVVSYLRTMQMSAADFLARALFWRLLDPVDGAAP